jgi:hypothetical protein
MDPYTKDIIEVIAWIAIALGFIGSIVALSINVRVFRLHRQSVQLDLYKGIMEACTRVAASPPDKNKEEDVRIWFRHMFNVLEFMAFCANRDYLSDGMKFFFHETCKEITKEMPEGNKSLLQALRKMATGSVYKELRTFHPDLPVFLANE